MNHEDYMKQCFELAKKAQGQVSPNPLVGCVIVKDDKIISRGYHKGSGMDHAELDAIKNTKELLEGSILYSNLEPCCHTDKRTPPCAQRIIAEGFSKVVISNLDPNPKVSGQGMQLLKDAGIEVVVDILKDEGERLNEVFFTHIVKKRPFIHIKYAQTLDGKLATTTGHSKWITSENSRINVHKNRDLYDAILIGGATLIKDDPKLTIRLDGKEKSKLRVILLSRKLENKNYKVFTDQYKDKTITIDHDQNLDLTQIMDTLYNEYAIKSLYVEGGAKTIALFLKQNLFDKISVYIAPKILGQGQSVLSDKVSQIISDGLEFKDISWSIIGEDVVLTAYKKD